MGAVALSGQDTFVINNYVFVGLADQNYVEITFPNDIMNVKIGKNGNAIYGNNESGKLAEVKVRAIRGGADDKFLNGLLTQQQQNAAGTPLLQGQYAKKLGDGQGNLTSDTYILGGGVFAKIPEGKSSADGEVEQSVAIYMLNFTTAPRVLT